LRKEFSLQMKAVFPSFVRMKSGRLPAPLWLYGTHAGPSLWFFIMLHIFEQRDQFTVEVACNNEPKPPESMITFAPDLPEPRCPEFFRIDCLWQANWDAIWTLAKDLLMDSDAMITMPPEEFVEKSFLDNREPVQTALERVEPSVSDAMDRIIQYVIPYFKEVAAAYGVIWEPTKNNTEKS
jgi:hypothetical protein